MDEETEKYANTLISLLQQRYNHAQAELVKTQAKLILAEDKLAKLEASHEKDKEQQLLTENDGFESGEVAEIGSNKKKSKK